MGTRNAPVRAYMFGVLDSRDSAMLKAVSTFFPRLTCPHHLQTVDRVQNTAVVLFVTYVCLGTGGGSSGGMTVHLSNLMVVVKVRVPCWVLNDLVLATVLVNKHVSCTCLAHTC